MSKIEIHEILEYLPHRYPFLLVDRVLELEEGKRVLAVKNVTINEPLLSGALSEQSGDARSADHRSDGAGGGGALVQDHEREAGCRFGRRFAGIDAARFKRRCFPEIS